MPQAITTPRRESSTGRSTAASLGPSFADADQRLHDAAALHFVIVLPNDPFLAGDVRRAEDLQQVVRVIRLAAGRRQSACGLAARRYTACRTTGGRPLCRNSMSRSATCVPS